MTPVFSASSRARLTSHHLARFSSNTLFDRIARTLCTAGCLPRKELYESWEVARRARRLFRGGRVIDLGGGHGLLAQMMLLLDDSSPSALVIDAAIPPSARTIHDVLVAVWPRLNGRVSFVSADLNETAIESGDVVVSSHACGALTDRVIALATAARARVAVLPCCHDEATCDAGALEGWMDHALAVDAMRAVKLESAGYKVWTQVIPNTITPKNRLLLGEPAVGAGLVPARG